MSLAPRPVAFTYAMTCSCERPATSRAAASVVASPVLVGRRARKVWWWGPREESEVRREER